MADPLVSRIGPSTGAVGTVSQNRSCKTGEQAVQSTHGKYYEASSGQVVFAACDQGAGVAVGTAISTTAILSLYNPPGSGKRLVINKVSLAYFSGTLGAGAFYHCLNNTATQTAPSGGTVLTPVCLDTGNTSAGVGLVRAGSTVVAPTAVRPLAQAGAALATTALGLSTCTEDVDGEFVVEPGCSYQIQTTSAAGSTPKVSPGISWEEVPIV